MTPQERQLIDDLFDRLAKLENAPRDSEAMSAIMQGLRSAPNAVYALVQTALVQDEALKRAHDRIQELEAAVGQPQGAQQQGGGFLDSMRDAIFGGQGQQPHGSVPPVRAPDIGGGRPVWNSGQAIQQAGGYGQPPQQYGQPQYNQPDGGPQPPAFGGGAPGGGGGSFLGTAAAAAAGVVGGGLLLSSIRGMMGGGGHQSLADAGGLGGGSRPWGGDQSSSDLARDAGINDVGSSGRDSGSRSGLFDQASNNNNDDNYNTDHDSDGFDNDDDGFDGGGDNDSDYA
ncbi:DUF2076 domain-containing protein [Bradyrhizobium mercantei]|uniref:DUF2076 domain-containing protein n=1 Tax=Bradyrhizobium mercantei TaxID=1904807 RepID=UPI000977B76F|nr:DUF2076 domain-containing protein [Bradyrhizobium mercantei]